MTNPQVGDVLGVESLASRLERLGSRYVRSRQVAEDDRATVTAAVVDADRAGMKPHIIAAHVGLSRSTVLNMIRDGLTADPEAGDDDA